MQVLQFIAPDAASALAQIHRQLGPDAVVLSVRPLPAQGVSRLLPRSGRIEVLAARPDYSLPSGLGCPANLSADTKPAQAAAPARWRTIAWLESKGLSSVHAERLQQQINKVCNGSPAASLESEWAAVQFALNRFWRPAAPLEENLTPRQHVLIGPSGSGKTTVLCKWLTLAVLTEERRARVWRLDGVTGNTSEFLTVHCEMLGVPVDRFWSAPANRGELHFIDLPGVEAHDQEALASLRAQLALFPNPCVHLVLNAAYESETLLDQWDAFAPLNPDDLILTHLDEETRRVKLWNLVFGTNCTIRFLSAGQKIPGEFRTALPELLLPSEISE